MASFDLVGINDASPLVKQFNQRMAKASGQMVIAFIPQKMKKIADELVKDLDFVLENGQTITLVARTNGDIIRVKLNGRDLPLKNELFHFAADTFQAMVPVSGGKYSLAANAADRNSPAAVFSKALDEIAGRVRANQAAFDKRRSQEKIVIPRSKDSTAAAASVPAKTRQLRDSLDQLDKDLVSKTAHRDELKQRLEVRRGQSVQLEAGAA